MREAEFKAWLNEQPYKASTRSTQLSNARKLEQVYDMDEEYERDGLTSLLDRLAYSANDAKAGRENPTKLTLWGDLVRDLSNLRTTVGVYAKFRGGADVGVDRRFVLYDATGTAYLPVRQFDQASGVHSYRIKPKGANNKTEDARQVDTLKELVWAVLFEKLPARFSPNGHGTANYLTYGRQKIVAYELEQGLAEELDVPPTLATQPPQEPVVWMVTTRDGKEDGTERFLADERWSLLTDEGSRYNTAVRTMKAGDVIVLRSQFTQSRDLPFDAKGRTVSAMRIRAIGRIRAQSEDELGVAVNWGEPEERTWYFYNDTGTIWRLPDGRIGAAKLREFLFDGVLQDYDWFLRHPQWAPEAPLSEQTDETPYAEANLMRNPENLILYGPPGTGKTYRTAEEAVRLCGAQVPTTRAELMKRYNELRVDGRIEFVTFHQNFSYEEFIEGLRPHQSSDENATAAGFGLRPEPGIFKRFVDRCQGIGRGAQRSESIDLEGRRLFKMSLGEANNSAYDWVFRDSINGGYALFGFAGCDWSDVRFASKQDILEQAQAMEPNEVLSAQAGVVKYTHIFRNEVQPGDVLIVSKGNSTFRAIGIVEGGYEYHPRPEQEYCHRRKVRWLWHDDAGQPVATISDTNFTMGTIYQLGRQSPVSVAVLQRLVDEANPAGVTAASDRILPYVLIIDEINRANVSKVFGELITLIETDKRKGMENALEVQLPYSREPFSVPANLHIVGTMNTADRSITQLDTALRRRFRFEEITPSPSLLPAMLDGVPLRNVLETINQRIEFLLDRDHRIGHAFFMACKTRGDLDRAMRDKVIPLLQEYFFEDWTLLAAVLGESEISARGDKGAFLGNQVIKDPTGRGASNRVSWWVRAVDLGFDEDAYDRLIKGIRAGSGYAADDAAEVDEGEQA